MIFRWVFKKVTTRGSGGGGSYNLDTGAISHPPKGKGKAPKVSSKIQVQKGKGKK